MTEKPEGKIPWPDTEEELITYIREMLKWPNGAEDMGEGYGRCVYAMSNAAVAAFNFVAGKLGVTGFQASCAELQFLKETRKLEHGFMIVDANRLLYPQYDPYKEVTEFLDKTRPRLREAAQKLLTESNRGVHPDVRQRWEEIAALPEPAET